MENYEKRIIKILDGFEQKGVIVYDIDDTLLTESEQPICPIIRTLFYAQLTGHDIAIITARPHRKNVIEWTILSLRKYGIVNIKYWYFRPEGETNLFRYKERSRKQIENNGNKILVSVGDSEWDIGKYGGIGILLF